MAKPFRLATRCEVCGKTVSVDLDGTNLGTLYVDGTLRCEARLVNGFHVVFDSLTSEKPGCYLCDECHRRYESLFEEV